MFKVSGVGRLTRDAELKSVGEHTLVTWGMAWTRFQKGEKIPQFVECSAWNKRGELVVEYAGSKGNLLFVSGNLHFDSWEKDGVKRNTLKIDVQDISFVGNKGEQ